MGRGVDEGKEDDWSLHRCCCCCRSKSKTKLR